MFATIQNQKVFLAYHFLTSTSDLGYLDLKRAQGAFWILLGGLAVAATFLFGELALKWIVVAVSHQSKDFIRA